MVTTHYRYVDDAEKDSIDGGGIIQSKSGLTWFTPDRYDTAADAEKFLALPSPRNWRVGPIPSDEMPDFDKVPLRPIAPAHGQPGGGVECATSHPVYLFKVVQLL